MKRKYPPVWFAAVLLALALLWRMLGSPLTAEQFGDLGAPFWQARVLMPSRVVRVLRLWLPAEAAPATDTLREDGMSEDERALERLARDGQEELLNVYLAKEDRLVSMPMDGYVCGVIAAEMPASYHMEALKAQAVAARTRALWQKKNGGCELHAGADVCTYSAHCQGYATLNECKAMWGDAYPAYRDRILEAEAATADELLTYEGEPITVMYHAISGGRTEDAATVFSQSLPYLVSVESQTEDGARGLTTETALSFAEIAKALNASQGFDLSAETVRRTLSVAAYTDSGRVKSMQIGDREIPATAFRAALGLRSTWFSLSMDENGATFFQRGYGHGVGMSQAGANGMAAEGANYTDILLHYYPGVTLEKR